MEQGHESRRTIVLSSGLPLRGERPTSFERQLRLLAEGFTSRGLQSTVLGPEPNPLIEAMRAASGVILLGYPDQFDALHHGSKPDIPIFLWTQCSRRPDPRSFADCMAVPLTPMTAGFLLEARVSRIGPVIPHGVDTGFFRPPGQVERAQVRRELGIHDRFLVGSVGANSRRKRFDLIMESFSLFAASCPKTALLIKTDRTAGFDGTDLSVLARKHGIPDRCIIIDGEIDGTRMRELYAAMDLFINLSEWEGFGLPVIEAMSMEVPVLTHRVQGPGELVTDQELVIQDSNATDHDGSRLMEARPDTAAAVMKEVMADSLLRRRLAIRGRAEIISRFDIRTVIGLWEELLEKE
jgi:glycosyltransferase involved in cell wall biosynthesis